MKKAFCRAMTHLFLSILKRHDDGSEINITVRAADAVSFSRAARAFFQAASQSTENFEWIKKSCSEPAPSPAHGALDIDAELRAAISEDLKNARGPSGLPISRYEVACRMSEMAGREISASMLYNWTAESHSENNFPLKYLPVFVVATGGQRRAFEVLARKCGLVALPGPEALRAEIQQMDEEIKRLRDERDKRRMFLKEIAR